MSELSTRRRGRWPREGSALACLALVAALACGRVEDGIGRTGFDRPLDSGVTADPTPGTPDAGPEQVPCGGPVRLHRIADRTPCAWALPNFSVPQFDPSHVNVVYENNSGPRFLLPLSFVPTSADCGTLLGWYFDDEARPTAILGCPRTCNLAAQASDAATPGFTATHGCPIEGPPK